MPYQDHPAVHIPGTLDTDRSQGTKKSGSPGHDVGIAAGCRVTNGTSLAAKADIAAAAAAACFTSGILVRTSTMYLPASSDMEVSNLICLHVVGEKTYTT